MTGVEYYTDTVWHCKSTTSSLFPLSNLFWSCISAMSPQHWAHWIKKWVLSRDNVTIILDLTNFSLSLSVYILFLGGFSSTSCLPHILTASLAPSPQSRVTPPTLSTFACLSSPVVSCTVNILSLVNMYKGIFEEGCSQFMWWRFREIRWLNGKAKIMLTCQLFRCYLLVCATVTQYSHTDSHILIITQISAITIIIVLRKQKIILYIHIIIFPRKIFCWYRCTFYCLVAPNATIYTQYKKRTGLFY